MNIAVTGIGYVGLVAAACLSDGGHHVICVDKDRKKIDGLKKNIIPIYEPGLTELVQRNSKAQRLCFTTDLSYGVQNSDIIIVGVGTPSSPDGSADISAVLDVSRNIAQIIKKPKVIVTKSTVPVGTYKIITDLVSSITDVPFHYVSNPEFLKEGSAVEDFLKPDRVIIGTSSDYARQAMQQVYAPFMRKSNRIIFMEPASAEMSKYASNAMLATRISFMNELSALCDTFGANIEMVRKGIGSDSRIGNSFLFAGVGFGGSCFPKDVRALIHMGDKQNCPMSIAQSVLDANYKQHERFAGKILDFFKGKENKTTLAVWGLAFKAKTDDIRESPAIWCIEKFLDAGFKIKAYDPEAMPAAKEKFGSRIQLAEYDYDVLESADALVVFTDWQEFRGPDFETIKKTLSEPLIFDGRNLYEPEYLAKLGFKYFSIGRPQL
ncbi:UDP-glucose 6-dehydrogenase TuaD [Limihaloglobus sulfuriphilus]|uniref:UDP-glucose 6-dehydrogenase n=1 Tax=Limihaloglobus sulfuriphilus TaxID=1851148 RepID=A0A1Q2MF69_9BACT|nr:UDP-glucose/GDP-mannose dehydrogenase family protein [Limihaloglobus sulfuriphilus]AQQ71320.1 UDP-glucose 6-dehydrogenase TuaD [Limihaloglobus sulfuriphilus]